MNHSYKYLIQVVLISTIMLILMTTNLSPRICANGSGGSYGDEEIIYNGIPGPASLIESHVIEGAGHFLNAYSNILIFLNRVEKSDLEGMDFKEAARILERAIENMDNALAVYNQLIAIAERTPYNMKTIKKLMDFDYNGFMLRHGLNSFIIRDVEFYLSNGDVSGMFKHIRRKFIIIKDVLISIKGDIKIENALKISEMWKLNEISSMTLLFGQYASMCFEETKIN